MKQETLFADRTIVVTGGTGSIGGAIVEAVLSRGPRSVRVVSRDDSKQFELSQRLRGVPALRMLIGDVRSRERMQRALAGADFVFHAAAMKHVPACEFNPFEASETNVRGTQNVIEAAIDAGVKRVLAISTDKAADPTNVMGATKLLAERMISAAEMYKGGVSTTFASVRFGNVIGSRGSLVPLVRSQVARGGPVTITDPAMTRYLMPIEDAVSLCFKALDCMRGGELFILQMPRVRIGDLVEVLIEAFAPQFGYSARKIPVDIIGPRAGEKTHEVLLTEDEAARARDVDGMFVIDAAESPFKGAAHAAGGRANEPPMEKAAIRELIHRAGWLNTDSTSAL